MDQARNTESLEEAPYNLSSHLGDLKSGINNLIWMYGPPAMTLGEADALACKVVSDMVDKFEGAANPAAQPPPTRVLIDLRKAAREL